MKLPTWMPSANVDAQMAHLGWGAFIVLAASFAFGPPLAWAALACWLAVKEFCFDLVIEQDSISDSVMDASFYVVGGVIGATTYFLL